MASKFFSYVVPKIAKNLTKPITVNSKNKNYLMQLISVSYTHLTLPTTIEV